MVKLEYLLYLEALQRAGSVNKSAQLLHTSAQNVSRVLRQTEAGLGAIGLAETIQGEITAFKRRFSQTSDAEAYAGELTVAATKIESVRFMNEAVIRFSRLHP